MHPGVRSKMTMWLVAFSATSMLPPLGPKALLSVAEVAPAPRRSATFGLETWSLTVMASLLGLRLGRSFHGGKKTVVDGARAALGVLALHLLLGAASSRWLQVGLRFACSAVVTGTFEAPELGLSKFGDVIVVLGAAAGAASPVGWRLLMDRLSAMSVRSRFKVFACLAFVAFASVFAHVRVSWKQHHHRRHKRREETETVSPREEEDESSRHRRRLNPHHRSGQGRRTRAITARKNNTDDGGPPGLYVEALQDDRVAGEKWAKTLKWRTEHRAEEALRRAQPNYHAVKRLYPHYLHGRTTSPRREVVMWELVGSLDTTPLRRGELTTDDAFQHFVFVHEFLSAKFNGEETRLVTILDVGGLRFSQVDSLLMKLIAAASNVVDNLVPYRATKIYVINTPTWFSAVWNSGIKRALPATVRDKVQVLHSKNINETLKDLVEEVPSEYGGATPLGQHDDELSMLEAVCVLNAQGSLFDETQFFGPDSPGGGGRPRRRLREEQEQDNLEEEEDEPLLSNSEETKVPSATEEEEGRQRRLLSLLPWRRQGGGQKAQKAHLGKSGQSFYYDQARRRWVFPEDEVSEETQEQKKDEDSDDEDEAALVAAIRAATLHKAGVQTEVEEDEVEDDDSEAGTLRAWLQIGCGLTRWARALMITAGPVWLLAPASRGGLGLSMTRAAGVCGTAWLLVGLGASTRASDAIRLMPLKAPLRAYRVATGACALAAAAAPVTVPSFRGRPDVLPRDSFSVAIAATLAVAVVAVATQLACAASAASLRIDGRAPFTSLAVLADLGGPLAAHRLLRPAFSADVRPYPLDASSGLSVAALAFAILYLLSLGVYKRVVGDVNPDNLDGQPRRATDCTAFLELPARDIQRSVDDAIEAYVDDDDHLLEDDDESPIRRPAPDVENPSN